MENVDDPPRPVLNNLYLNEVTGPVKVNITTIDSADPSDYYTKLVIHIIPMYHHMYLHTYLYSLHYVCIIMKLAIFLL